MIKVYFESNSHAELVATFETEEVYDVCIKALEKKAKEHRMILTESVEEPEVIHMIFGEDATGIYHTGGIDDLVKELNDGISCGLFKIIEGETTAGQILEAMNGWFDYAEITEEEFNRIINETETKPY